MPDESAATIQKATKPSPEKAAGTPSILPRPDYRFKGEIGRTVADSAPARFPQPVTAPADAPNLLLILLDDVSFGQFGTFGGSIPTPGLDALAAEGLRYNRFHTTAICSPTRAALLTGRNHHVACHTKIAEGRLERTVPVAFSSFDGLDVGLDRGAPVDFTHKPPLAFTGRLDRVTVDLQSAGGSHG